MQLLPPPGWLFRPVRMRNSKNLTNFEGWNFGRCYIFF